VDYGVSFSKEYTESLGLDWQKTYLAILTDLKPKYLRIAAPWNQVESVARNFDFSNLDWQMQEAEKQGVKVVLAMGQKAPRWPECYVPDWVKSYSDQEYAQELAYYLKQVVERYKNSPALEVWQVENEPLINFSFGECPHYSRDLLSAELKLVKSLDAGHPTIVTDSGELSTWRETATVADLFGTTVYRVVRMPSGRAWTYDWLPPSTYRLKGELWGRAVNGLWVMEMQAEPWFSGGNANNTPLSVQAETMNPERFSNYFNYVERIGSPRAYLWGVEWWYWMKEKQNDVRFWEMAGKQIADSK